MPKLSEEDQAKVDAVLSQGIYKVDRAPFRPWLLLLIIIAVLAGITAVSYLIAAFHGYI